jgi:hypothetical protein
MPFMRTDKALLYKEVETEIGYPIVSCLWPYPTSGGEWRWDHGTPNGAVFRFWRWQDATPVLITDGG